jgi:hypothetical protein
MVIDQFAEQVVELAPQKTPKRVRRNLWTNEKISFTLKRKKKKKLGG